MRKQTMNTATPLESASTLSPEQESACRAIINGIEAGRRELTFTGCAGTGKTTTMKHLIALLSDMGRPVVLVAPTGKAALRLAQSTGRHAKTIHSLLYRTVYEDKNEDGEVELNFHHARSITQEPHTVVICDEASMVGSSISREILKHLPEDCCILYVGDREQLQPVKDVWGADFEDPTANLTQIHRQAQGSPIIQLSKHIREGGWWRDIEPDGKTYKVHRDKDAGVEAAARWLAQARRAGASATLLTYTNAIRHKANALVRTKLDRDAPLCVGDTLLCRRNCHAMGIMNGEVVSVKGFTPVMNKYEGPGESGDVISTTDLVRLDVGMRNVFPFTAPKLLSGNSTSEDWADATLLTGVDEKNVMQAEYGECLTIHSAQGSEFDHVGLIIDNSFEFVKCRNHDEYRRLLYTAVTRAAKRLIIFSV